MSRESSRPQFLLIKTRTYTRRAVNRTDIVYRTERAATSSGTLLSSIITTIRHKYKIDYEVDGGRYHNMTHEVKKRETTERETTPPDLWRRSHFYLRVSTLPTTLEHWKVHILWD